MFTVISRPSRDRAKVCSGSCKSHWRLKLKMPGCGCCLRALVEMLENFALGDRIMGVGVSWLIENCDRRTPLWHADPVWLIEHTGRNNTGNIFLEIHTTWISYVGFECRTLGHLCAAKWRRDWWGKDSERATLPPALMYFGFEGEE